MNDIHLFNDENIFEQLKNAPYSLGTYILKFYTQAGKPVNRKTDTLSIFYLFPSGGTLRDDTFNIVFYNSRFDTYRGFKPPHTLDPTSGD